MLEPGSFADHSLPGGRPLEEGQNPFPGLRPFGVKESHLYFGREKEISDVLEKLHDFQFVAILGYSGSGKSSMMLSGVIPRLTQSYSEVPVQIITTRPGIHPLSNLAEAVLRHDENHVETPFTVSKSGLVEQFGASHAALRQVLKKLNNHPAGKSLVVVDQFEELFRLAENGGAKEANQFVDLLMHACKERNIFVAITLRSDQIGGSARFTELTNLINKSNYLIPQLTREEKRKAIVGPVAVGGGEISESLVNQLLDEIEVSQDQLPVLQHAMMRTWEYWTDTREEGEPLEVRHYNAIGGISEALSQHANEAYDELSSEQKRIAEVLFKSLTAKGQDNAGLRRPVQISNVASQAQVTAEEVIEVVDKFRGHGRSFLLPAEVQLTAESLVEISHESLMRIWNRLNAWVDEEHESAQMYLRLSEAAAMYQVGRTGLWRPPDLQLALNWQKKQQPTYEWGARYDEAYERTMVFLDTSRVAYEAEQEHQEMMQKKLLRRTRLAALILGIFAVIAILFFIYALLQNQKANELRAEAEVERDRAVQAEQLAKDNEALAQEKQREAEMFAAEAEAERQNALESAQRALQARNRAEANFILAEEQRILAIKSQKLAEDESYRANREKRMADLAKVEAQTQARLANNRLYLSVAQSMAVRSLTEDNSNIQGLMAQQAFNFNSQHDGRKYDPYIYNGLFNALQTFKGENYNSIEGVLRNSARTIVMSKDGDNFYATGTQGRIIRGSLSKPNDVQIIGRNEHSNRKLLLSSDETWLINASDSSGLQLFSLLDRTLEPKVIEGHTSFVNDIKLSSNADLFYSVGSDKMIRLNNIRTGTSELLLTTNEEFKVITLSKDEQWLYGGTISGKVIRVNLKSKQEGEIIFQKAGVPIHGLAYSDRTNLLAVGDEDGILHLMDMGWVTIQEEVTIHRGRISSLEFSSNGTLLASSGLDGSVVIYETEKWNEIPIKIADNDSYVWDVAFSPDANYLLTACGDGDLRIWPTRPALMAGEICQYLQSNFTKEDWLKYVDSELEYEITCDNIQITATDE